jgi:hypothetical protein
MKKVKQNQTWNKIKKNLIGFLDRRKHTARENIRLAVVVSAIIFAIGIFCPMLGANMKFSMVDATKTDASAETVIFQPSTDIINVSASDFIFQKPLREFAIFGQKLGDIQIIGINLYDTLTTPLPDFSGLKDAENFLNSGVLAFLTDENFVKFCTENLGDFGKILTDIGKSVNEIATQVGGILGEVNNVLDGVTVVSDNVREGIHQAESALSAVEVAMVILFALILAVALLIIFQKKPNYFAPVMMTIFSVIFVAIGIAVIIINSAIAGAIESGMNDLNTSIEGMLNGILPGLSDLLAQLTSANKISFVLNLGLYCGTGWWMMTITLVTITMLSYIQTYMYRKKLKVVEADEIVKKAVAEAKKELKAENKESAKKYNAE